MLYNDEKNDLLGQTGGSAVKGACHQIIQTEMNARSKQWKKRTDSSTLSSNPHTGSVAVLCTGTRKHTPALNTNKYIIGEDQNIIVKTKVISCLHVESSILLQH